MFSRDWALKLQFTIEASIFEHLIETKQIVDS